MVRNRVVGAVLGGLLPGNKVIDKINLNLNDSIELPYNYSLLYICETKRNGARALFSTGWDKVDKWAGSDEWVASDKSDKFCFFRLTSKPGSFVLKNNLVDGGVFDVYIL